MQLSDCLTCENATVWDLYWNKPFCHRPHRPHGLGILADRWEASDFVTCRHLYSHFIHAQYIRWVMPPRNISWLRLDSCKHNCSSKFVSKTFGQSIRHTNLCKGPRHFAERLFFQCLLWCTKFTKTYHTFVAQQSNFQHQLADWILPLATSNWKPNPPTPLWRWRRAYWGDSATLNAQWHLLI